jgi:hypothetical protein
MHLVPCLERMACSQATSCSMFRRCAEIIVAVCPGWPPCSYPVSHQCLWPCVACSADVKNTQTTGPVLIHVITDKGRGYDPAVSASDRMHGVGKFDKATGKQFKTKSKVRGLVQRLLHSTPNCTDPTLVSEFLTAKKSTLTQT